MKLEQRGGALEQLKKIIMTISILFVMIISINVKAATLTDEEYNRLKNVFSDQRISLMTDEDAKRYLSYDLDHSNKVSKYFKVTETTNGTITTEVSKEEATNAAKESNNLHIYTLTKHLHINNALAYFPS